jgi:hypothetical protein
MKHLTVLAALVAAAALSPAPVVAQSLTGTWELAQETQRGPRTSTLVLVQDGTSLTGTLTLTLGGRRGGGGGGGGRGGTREFDIEGGTVDGNSFSFTMTLSFGDNSFTQEYTGTFDGDSMEGEIAGGGRRGGGGGARPFTGKRGG